MSIVGAIVCLRAHLFLYGKKRVSNLIPIKTMRDVVAAHKSHELYVSNPPLPDLNASVTSSPAVAHLERFPLYSICALYVAQDPVQETCVYCYSSGCTDPWYPVVFKGLFTLIKNNLRFNN